MTKRRARVYDALALLVIIIIVGVDQWTKALVVEHLYPPETGPQIHLIGQYLLLFYIRNNGAAFSLFANSVVLIGLITIAVAVICYIYARMINSGSLTIKLIMGMIVGGALGNIIDRIRHSGYVVDFIAFRIPQIKFNFAIFNVADASISVGVFLFFVAMLMSSFRHPRNTTDVKPSAQKQDAPVGKQQRGTS
ncbi:MAG TPA: signal peptidase II [Ktedonobacteraceae bacterium]